MKTTFLILVGSKILLSAEKGTKESNMRRLNDIRLKTNLAVIMSMYGGKMFDLDSSLENTHQDPEPSVFSVENFKFYMRVSMGGPQSHLTLKFFSPIPPNT